MVYPNPTNGIFTLSTELNNGSIEIIDLLGKQVLSKVVSEKNTEIDISNQPKGIYLVKVLIGNSVTVQKIIYQ